MAEPPTKRVKLSLEPLPEQKIEKYNQDGTEAHEVEMTLAQKFVEHVRQLNWKDDAEENEEEKPKAFTEYKWEAARIKVQENLGRSLEQVRRMLEIIEEAKQGTHFWPSLGVKPPMTEVEEQNQVLYQVGSKRKQLAKASTKLKDAYEYLEKNLKINDNYYGEVFALRDAWKINSLSDQIEYSVDYSMRNDGSRVVKRDLMLTKNEHGQIELNVNNVVLYNTLQIGTEDCNILVPPVSFDPSIITQLANEPMANMRKTGVQESHLLLRQLQESLFSSEIFDTAALQKSSLTQYLENVITFETTDENMFFVRLVTPKTPPLPTRGSDLYLETIGAQRARETRENIFRVAGICMHQLVRRLHTRKREEDHKFKSTKDFLREKDKAPQVEVMKQMLSLYKHLRACEEVVRGLDRYAFTVPYITWCTVTSPSPLVSVYELIYDNCSIVTATVIGDKISLPSLDNINTFSELIKHVTHKLILHTLDIICGNFALFLPEPDSILKKGTKVVVNISQRMRILIKAEMPVDPVRTLFPITVCVQKAQEHSNVPEELELDWWAVKGKSNQQKALSLIMRVLKEENLL